MTIKTWDERCEDFDDMHVVTHADIQRMMQAEIDELRAALSAEQTQERDAARADLAAARELLREVRPLIADRWSVTLARIDAALAEPEPTQEPVAWATMLGSYALITWQQRKPDENQYSVPLYAHPAPAQTPMTDREVFDYLGVSENSAYAMICLKAVRMAESFHGIGPAR
jgi:hypothetical protein